MSLPQTKRNEIIIGERHIYIETISNIDDLFDDLLKKGAEHEDVRDERIPYWADVWPSAVGLSEFLSESKYINSGVKVLELGCGVGLPGILAGQLGAQVIFTDYIQDALDLAKRNWELNNGGNAKFKLMDWRNPDPGLTVDIVLASDIAYEKKSFEDLIRAFKTLLTPGGIMLIAEPNRAFAQPFFTDLAKVGFNVKSEKEDLTFRDQQYSIHIHELRLSNNSD